RKNEGGKEKDGEDGEYEDEEEEEESHIITDFSECMYGYEDKVEFQEAFDDMRNKVHKQTWLDSIYKLKEKMAECYMRDVFSLGVRSTQLSESINNLLKNHLKSDFHIVRFLMHFERTVEVKGTKELQSEFEQRKKLPRIKMHTPMLVLASNEYTPIIFESFQGEYERSMAACTRVLDGNNKVGVAIGSLHGDLHFEEERIVIGDPLTKTASCSCGMFNRTGILCGHGLKVLDLMNIKTLPTHYVLKRWTREARNGSIQDRQGRNVVENLKFEAQLWYKGVSHKFHTMAHKVTNSLECRLILENALDCVGPQLDEKLDATMNATKKPCDDQENVDPNVQLTSEFLSAAKLKKKEVASKNLRRKKGWLDKLLKGKRKPTKVALSKKEGAKQQKKNDGGQPQVRVEKDDGGQPQVRVEKDDGGQPQVRVEKDDGDKRANVELQESNTVVSYTQLLMTPLDGVYDENLF
ncbi:protein FAR1-RELATED SEQUENCE 5-like, partial [Aegilops tauschii subsp. strangulata]|uniref:protein FAR1-RELATED SEQUENCE 5-like n=1 Tax=Aegilops tauschii subsp. strangulata TaxID=200361 RepID=UPI003CC8C552